MITLPGPKETVSYFGGGGSGVLMTGVNQNARKVSMKDIAVKVGGGIAQNNGELQPLVVVSAINKLTQEQLTQLTFSPTEALEFGMRLLSTAHEVMKDTDVFKFLRDQETARGADAERATAIASQSLALMRAARTNKDSAAEVVPN